ncbi:hypothetical protein LCI18_001743 [Fusarium solani-melongenae]|uniref:Uncharacterized protein n=1 Tax=Fusarium solani subsp. cucurbitae TaxID=2747967 RepID=A0ACD3YPM6_FUSSC|nr:hypothetical protein LCI18_001743 [Fusarium solani-melongenae]
MVLLKLPWGTPSCQDTMESCHGASAENSPHKALVRPPALPVEIWQQIILHSMTDLSVRNAFGLRLVSRNFSLMAMKAIHESGILRKCWHLPEEKRRNKFWVDYLTARVMNKVLTLEPSSEHLWLKAIAERILEWREEERAQGDRPNWSVKDEDELENLVRQISEFAAFQGEFSDPLNFYLGLRTCGEPRVPVPVLDESCGLFRDALLAVAVYLNETTFLHDRLDACSKVTCTHCPPLERHKGHYRPAPFNCHPIYNTERFGRKPSKREDAARFTFGSPISVAMQMRRNECLTALIKSLEDFPSELLLCRAKIFREADRMCNMEYMHLAIEADPPFTACPALRPRDYGFYDDTRKEHAVKIFRDFLNTTIFLEVFDMLYPIMTANCQAGKVPYWDYYGSGDNFERWGTKRMYKAIRDGSLPIVKRLVQHKFSIGPQPMVEALESGYDYMVEYFLSLGVRLDGALAVPARTGDVQMAQFLLDKGAGKNKESVRNAVEEAMIHGNEAMVMFLVEKAPAKGLLNKKAKANLKRVLGDKNKPDMLPLLKLL